MVGCASWEAAPDGRNKYIFYHKPLVEASRSLEEARLAGKDKECPAEFNAAKDMVDKAYQVYEACHTQEAINMAQEAIIKIKALCPAKPVPEARPEPKVEEKVIIPEKAPAPVAPAPVAPVPVAPIAKAPEKVSITLEIEFDSGKANIKPQYDDKIKKVADFMTAYPETTAIIEGHTDNVGSEKFNRRLSTQRAESVKSYLIQKFGISPGRLSAKGFGSSQPVADNKTAEGRQKNRRINVVIETITR
jgi:outer membrane protein OmpA-like peptidoglycan-associated protein